MSIRSFFGFGFNKPKVFLKKRFDGKKNAEPGILKL